MCSSILLDMEKVWLNSINKKQNGLDQSKNEKSVHPPLSKTELTAKQKIHMNQLAVTQGWEISIIWN